MTQSQTKTGAEPRDQVSFRKLLILTSTNSYRNSEFLPLAFQNVKFWLTCGGIRAYVTLHILIKLGTLICHWGYHAFQQHFCEMNIPEERVEMKQNRLCCLLGILVLSSLKPFAQVQPPPYFNVPIIWGQVGDKYLCMTSATGDSRIATITCDKERYQHLPVYWQQYVMAHEHGHVYQVYYKIPVSGARGEADAECYAGKYLAIISPGTAVAIVGALRAYGGNQAIDLIHGTGNERAAVIDRCARTVVPNYDANGIKGAIIR